MAPTAALAELGAPPGEIMARVPAGPVPAGPFWQEPMSPVLVPDAARPAPAAAADAAPALACRAAIARAERAQALPHGLLQAIALVETGRRVRGQARAQPWPWSVDFDGRGAFFASPAAAIQAVQAARGRGMRSIDVGCLQVNLLHHQHAFASLEQAFDPAANAAYAARFLRALYGQTHDWGQAAAAYHSQTPALAGPYRARVMQAWAGLGGPADQITPTPVAASSPFAPLTPLALTAPLLPGGYRILRAAPTGGVAPPGRGLAAYRARPIAIARRGS